MPRFVEELAFIYTDKSIRIWSPSQGTLPKRFLFLLKETNYPAINYKLWENVYKAQVLVIAFCKGKRHDMRCILHASDYLPKVPINAFHVCMKVHADIDGKCPVCEKLNIQWHRYTDEVMLKK